MADKVTERGEELRRSSHAFVLASGRRKGVPPSRRRAPYSSVPDVGAVRQLEWRDYSATGGSLTMRPELNQTGNELQIPVDVQHTPEPMAIIRPQLTRRRAGCPFIFQARDCGKQTKHADASRLSRSHTAPSAGPGHPRRRASISQGVGSQASSNTSQAG